jgi:hypothetical protein
MRTLVLTLPEIATGEFNRLGVLQIPLTINADMNSIGEVVVGAVRPDISILTITSGELYSDAARTISLGTSITIPTASTRFYFKITGGSPRFLISNLSNIRYLGGSGGYLFSDVASNAGGVINTSDLRSMDSLEGVWVSKNLLQGSIADIPSSVTDLRVEHDGLRGNLNDIQSGYFTWLRLIQPNITGNLNALAGRRILNMVLDAPLVTGDIVTLLNVAGIAYIGIGNPTSNITTPHPITCSLNADVFFQTLSVFSIKKVHLNRLQLLNTLKSLAKTTFTGTSAQQVQLTTTMTQAAYNADSEIQAAVTVLKSRISGIYTMFFA